MTNHYHILLETHQNNLSKVIQFLNDKYAKYFNKKYKRIGHLWQGRYKSFALYDDAHFWVVAKYIERNPIAASMVNSVSDYKHQSFSEWIHKSKYFALLTDSKIFDMTLKEYTEYISTVLDIDAIEIVYKSPKLVKKDGKLKILSKRIETFFEDNMLLAVNILNSIFKYKAELENILNSIALKS